LRVALAVPPVQALSPYSNDATVLSKLSVAEGLTALDRNGTAKPALAKSWKQDDATTWTFELRKAAFQDGTKLTARSVVDALDHANAARPKPRVLSDVTLTATAEDADTVTLTTKSPDPVLPLRLASPALAILSAKAYGEDGAVSPVGTGTGPFEITRLSGKTKATLDRFDGYWGGKAVTRGIDVSWIADGTARANALRGGETDIAEWIPTAQAKLLDEATRHEVPSVRTDSLILNTRSGLFADAGLRAAVREAVDGSALVDSVFGGYADPAQGLFGPAVPWAAGLRVKVTGRTEATHRPGAVRDRGQDAAPGHLHQPCRAPRGRDRAPAAAGEGRVHGEAGRARVHADGVRPPRREVRRPCLLPGDAPGHR
jgi:peptide/nickel transport system substrate-binding protein